MLTTGRNDGGRACAASSDAVSQHHQAKEACKTSQTQGSIPASPQLTSSIHPATTKNKRYNKSTVVSVNSKLMECISSTWENKWM